MASDPALGDVLVARAEATREPFDPEITLFLDASVASAEARCLLDAAGEEYRLLQAESQRLPTAVFGLATYEGIAGIHELLRDLQSLDDAVRSAYARHQPGRAHGAAPEHATASGRG